MAQIVCIIVVFYFLLSNLANAQHSQLRDISQTRTWQKLLHIENDKSDITNSDFYHSNISTDFSYQELKATLSSITSNPMIGDQTYRCKFPARVYLLAQYQLTTPVTAAECPYLFKWFGADNFGISLIFADGYLGNPASFYGHMIIKFESDSLSDDLFSNSLNFGAKVPDDENPVMYILKGLFGGYTSRYTSNYFYRHNINYNEIELRDLWKYRLELDEYHKYLLAFHLWELLDTEYTYYFTDRNCAYEIAKALEVITDQDLISTTHPFVLPISVFKNAMTSSVNGRKLIQSVNYMPSRQTRMQTLYAQLSSTQQALFHAYLESPEPDLFNGYSVTDKITTLNALYDYTVFVLTQISDDDTIEQNLWEQMKKEVQIMRILLPPNSAATTSLPVHAEGNNQPKAIPHSGHNPSLTRVTAGQRMDANFIELTLRPAFYDLYSKGGGMLPSSALSMGQLSVRAVDNDVELSHLHFITIETYPTNRTGLPYDQNLAWKLNIGIDRDYLTSTEQKLTWFAELGVGKALSYSSNTTWYLMLNSRLQTENHLAEYGYLSPTVGFITEYSHLKGGCELAMHISNINTQQELSCTAALLQTDQYDIRINYRDYYFDEFSVGFSWYW
jgi:hypothetical protein